jgi:hypothetical protein
MESPETRADYFAPISHAFSDTMLQVRAKPLVFVLIWLLLSLAPQILLSYAFQNPVSDMMDASLQLINETIAGGDGASAPASELSGIIFRGIRAVAVMMAVLLLAEMYLGSVLAGVVRQFRNRTLPVFTDSLRKGAVQFPDFVKAVFSSGIRILFKPFVVFIIAGVAGLLLNQQMLIYFFFIISGILFLMGLLRYGLGHFVHLSMGSGGRDSALISKVYYLSHRPVVSLLFMFVILLPMVVVSLLMNLLISLGLFGGIGGMILGILQSLLQLIMTVVVINFAMNNFLPQDWGIGSAYREPDTPEIPAEKV